MVFRLLAPANCMAFLIDASLVFALMVAHEAPAQTPEPPAANTPATAEHPLMPALRIANDSLAHLEKNVRDYSCTMVKRERVDGKLGEPEYIFMKIRHEPFSVYTYFLKPDSSRGQEAIYVEGKNNNKLLAHSTGIQAVLGTMSLDPNGSLAMRGQRYPITTAGLKKLVEKMITLGEHDTKYGECEVKFFKGAKIENRSCLMIEIHHPVQRRNFRYALARIYVDDEWKVPVRFEGYEWPAQAGQPLVLVEEYTYLRIQFNRGYTDLDFDPKNTNYKFP